jgi:glucokinase
MLLGGDLGGTKTLLALAEPVDDKLCIIRQQRYASADFADFDSLLGDFLPDAPTIEAACFGLAGPTDGRSARLTYLPWQLEAEQIGRRFGIAHVSLANDFAAAAHGLPLVAADEFLTLHPGQPLAAAPRVILGAGTGLGVAGLLPENGRNRVIPGEGGHFGFSPQSREQGELWRWLHEKLGRVTTEDVVSGPGLARIYEFLGGDSATPEWIGQSALAAPASLAGQAVRLWQGCYGAFAGDLALHWLARGGVYLAGGIAAKLLPTTGSTAFIEAFLNKREHADLVREMPLTLVRAEDLGLRGALAIAADSAT